MSVTPNDVKLQLMASLPRYTEEYGTNKEGVAIVAGGVVSVTSVAHGLETGDVIVTAEATVTIPVTGSAYDPVTLQTTLELSTDHDRTSGSGDNGGYNVATLQDFDDANYNDEFTIISAEDDTINFKAGSGAGPVGALGNFVETRGLYLGFSEVVVGDEDTFTIPVQDDLVNGIEFNSFKFVSEQRIYVAADGVRATTTFGHHRGTEPSLFIIFGPESVSKDRTTQNDAAMTATAQNSARLKYIPEVTLMTIACTKGDQLASAKMQQIHEEIKPALRQAMYAYVFDTSDVSLQFAAIEVNNAQEFYNQSNIVHSFDYQIPYDITFEQGNTYRRNVSFRNIILNSKMFDNDGDLVIVDADLEI